LEIVSRPPGKAMKKGIWFWVFSAVLMVPHYFWIPWTQDVFIYVATGFLSGVTFIGLLFAVLDRQK
jgi:hypothetical protein